VQSGVSVGSADLDGNGGGDPSHVVFGGVALGAAGLEIIGVFFALRAEDERQRRQAPIVRQIALVGTVAAGVQQMVQSFSAAL